VLFAKLSTVSAVERRSVLVAQSFFLLFLPIKLTETDAMRVVELGVCPVLFVNNYLQKIKK